MLTLLHHEGRYECRSKIFHHLHELLPLPPVSRLLRLLVLRPSLNVDSRVGGGEGHHPAVVARVVVKTDDAKPAAFGEGVHAVPPLYRVDEPCGGVLRYRDADYLLVFGVAYIIQRRIQRSNVYMP